MVSKRSASVTQTSCDADRLLRPTIRRCREPLRRHVLRRPEVAFANVATATRTGGRLCFVCWQETFANEWIAVPAIRRDPEDVVAFMLSDEMGRRLVEGKDPEAVQAGTEASLEALQPYHEPVSTSVTDPSSSACRTTASGRGRQRGFAWICSPATPGAPSRRVERR